MVCSIVCYTNATSATMYFFTDDSNISVSLSMTNVSESLENNNSLNLNPDLSKVAITIIIKSGKLNIETNIQLQENVVPTLSSSASSESGFNLVSNGSSTEEINSFYFYEVRLHIFTSFEILYCNRFTRE